MDSKAEIKQESGKNELSALFEFFNEIGIINQLASTLFQKKLADGVTVAQFSVLNHLIRVKDGQTPLVLATAFQVPKTTMTHTLFGLEKRGFVVMKRNADDGRSKCVWLTDAGRSFRERSIAALSEEMVRLTPLLEVREMTKITPLLATVRKVLDKDRN